MADKEELLAQFVGITGVDNDRATFFLEAAGWNLDVAMGNFYDDGGSPEIQEVGEVRAPPATEEAPPANRSSDARSTQPPPRQPGIRTLGSLHAAEDGSDSDEEGQAFFAGGSEHSGQQILGPRRRRGDVKDIVKEMFEAARGHGAEEVDPREEAGAEGGARAAPFAGSGYRLGQTADDTVVVSAPPDRRPPEPRTVKLKLWKSGFSVDDGDVRDYADPANQEFLNAIRAGQVPPELIREAQGGEVHLDMEDHRHEDFEKPKPKLKPFSGKGYVLGSPAGSAAAAAPGPEAPEATGAAPPALPGVGWLLALLSGLLSLLTQLVSALFSPAPEVVGAEGGGGGGGGGAGATGSAGDPAASEEAARAALALDESQPVTSVQVRLIDGSRLVIKLNHSHTVGQLRQYIAIARPQFASRPFTLLTTYPSKELMDESVTMEEGQLLNAAILQRAK